LERFFRNLLLGEQWYLRNRYLHIHPTEEWKVQLNRAVTNGDTCQSDKYPTSTRQVPDKLDAVNPNIIKLVQIIGEQEMTVKDLMTSIGLKDRENFLKLYLNPAISEGYVRLLYPQSPRHPRQKYLLTAKGLEVLKGV
jgi:hypothetical protein